TVAVVNTLIFLAAGELHLGHVETHEVIARVEVGRVVSCMLALKDLGGACRDAAEHLAIGVNHMPFGGSALHGRYVSRHPDIFPTSSCDYCPWRVLPEDGKPKSYTHFGAQTRCL